MTTHGSAVCDVAPGRKPRVGRREETEAHHIGLLKRRNQAGRGAPCRARRLRGPQAKALAQLGPPASPQGTGPLEGCEGSPREPRSAPTRDPGGLSSRGLALQDEERPPGWGLGPRTRPRGGDPHSALSADATGPGSGSTVTDELTNARRDGSGRKQPTALTGPCCPRPAPKPPGGTGLGCSARPPPPAPPHSDADEQ